MSFMILVLIGSTVIGSAGAAIIQSKQPSRDSYEALTSVSVFAGNGEFEDWDGAALEASFRMPQGMVVLKDGSVLVADSRNHLIRQVREGQVSTYAGIMLDADASGAPSGAWYDGTKQTAVFNNPSGMDTDSEDNLYIADTNNHLIRKISKDGVVSTIAGDGILGQVDGKGKEARFYQPQDVAVAADGTLYVADTLNHLIRQITPDGQVTTLNAPSDRVIEVIGGYAVLAGDFADGELSTAKFNEPTSITIDHKGNLYVSDTGNHVIRYIDLAKGTVTTVTGLSQGELPVYADGALYAKGGYEDGSSSEARFHSPRGIAVTEEQGLIIADSLNHTIRYLVNGQVSTIAGVPAQFGHVDGINDHNLLHHPTDVATLPNGNLLISDSYNNKIRELEFYELPSNLPQNDAVKIVYEDQIIHFEMQPEIVKGSTMIPVRALSEAMGYVAGFNDTERTMELTKGDVSIKLQVGSRVISIKNAASDVEERQEMDTAPYLKAGTTYVPVKYFSEAFGVDVEWHQSTKTVILRGITEAVEKMPTTNRNSRAAKLEQIKGTVWVKQAGGSLAISAYEGISLHHGDQIVTELNSSALLKTVDRKDEITIGENAELYISNLSEASKVMHSSFYLWSGAVVASVTSLVNAKDTFKILTSTAVNDVRGTNFFIGVDPRTGNPELFVLSGNVQVGGYGTSQSPFIVYPASGLTISAESDANRPINSYPVDLASLISQTSPDIIVAFLKQNQKIEQENEQFLKDMMNATNPIENPYGQSPEDLERLKANLANLSANIAKQALEQNKISSEELKTLLDIINKDTNNPIDLNNVLPLELSDQEKQEQLRQKLLEEQRKKKLEEQNKLREQQRQQKEEHLAALLAEKKRLEQENKRKLEEAGKKAEESYKEKLSDAEQQRFEQQQQELKRQRQLQEAAQQLQEPTSPPASMPTSEPEPPASGSTPNPGPTPEPEPKPVNTAPMVIKPIANWMVNTEKPFEIDVSQVFSDVDGDILTFTASSNDTAIAQVEVKGAIITISPYGMGSTDITITANDGNGGTAETVFHFGLYPEIANVRAENRGDNVQLYWDGYEEGLSYHIYIDNEFFEPTKENMISLTDLQHDTDYLLRIVAVNDDEEVVAFADFSIRTNPIN